MIDLTTLALVSFLNVFVLAFQSRNINSGNYVGAAVFSIGIGLSQAFVWKTVTAKGTIEMLVYSVFGGVGCVTAMRTHAWLANRNPRRS